MGYDGENLYLGIDEPEPKTVGQCAYCREAIYEGTECFCCNGVLVHTECWYIRSASGTMCRMSTANRNWPGRWDLNKRQHE